jgi:hypothetical protein
MKWRGGGTHERRHDGKEGSHPLPPSVTPPSSLASPSPPPPQVSLAASRQLKHIVHDARKHTLRRLRQLDTQLASDRRAGGSGSRSGSFWSQGSSGACVFRALLVRDAGKGTFSRTFTLTHTLSLSHTTSHTPSLLHTCTHAHTCAGSSPAPTVAALQSYGLEVLRQGVHLYLEELVLVLDAWSCHLGLEQAQV